ncbi:ATP-binding protein [uncultured Fibrobacter sp.]|uniref:ATP-binding protein n=1 Tax=uncultured Fibrobacter sp. TaxID=261512 RepID=UPI00262ADDF7|nr:ATP-binding protein [uncultured Fibrobacter sp.]
MTLDELKKLISKDETKNVELKKSTGELREGMHTACAFLNSDGGVLVFGVTPSLNIVGQIVSESTRRDIAQALAGIEPAVTPVIEYVDIPGKPNLQVIVLRFNPWVYGQKPYTFHGKPYYRLESVTKAMPRDMFDERIRINMPHQYSWEMRTAEGYSIKDLNAGTIRGVVRLGVEEKRIPVGSLNEPIKVILKKWNLLDGDNVRNAAVFLFSKRFSFEYLLRMARFRGTDKNYFIDNQQAHGNFFDLLDAGMGFFFKHLSLSGEIKGLKREEHLDVPVAALREALINALCHRDYDIHQCSIGIAIYDDRIEIESPGLLPHELTPKTIKRSHQSFPRNEVLANVLYQTTYLEKWGSGIKRIMDACRAENSPQPFWSEQTGYTVVTFPLNKLNGKIVTQNAPQNDSQSDSQNDSQKRAFRIKELVVQSNSVSVKTIAETLELSEITVRRYLKKMGYVWKGAPKKGYWFDTQNVSQNDTQSDSQNDALNDTQNEKNVSRTEKVLQVVSVNSMISKDALATMFGVTKLTILRDLQKLGFVWEGASKNGHWVREKGRFVDANKTSVKKVTNSTKKKKDTETLDLFGGGDGE